jgi:exodeoxyribonuclease VII large subunit
MNGRKGASLNTSPAERELTVSDVLVLTSSLLEEALPSLDFIGEIGEVRAGKTGHQYFTLKDDKSQLAAVLWAGVSARSRVKLKPGLAVKVTAHPTVYPPRGSLQFVIDRIAEAGEGTLQKKFLELKAKLEREGLFSVSRKRPLPSMPERIGVVTSANGAVIHDIMHRISERFPSVEVILIDVRVQGEGSAEEIARAIEQFNRMEGVDALIVGRGGGSLEDLWAFNEERVVRAVYASRIPVVSAVGHETDVTLCDFVADVRAPTPTAAAELLVPRRDELLRRVEDLGARLLDGQRVLAPLQQRLDEVEMRFERSLALVLERSRNAVKFSEQRLRLLQPATLLKQLTEQINNSAKRIELAINAVVERSRSDVRRHSERLEAVNPRAVLKRGYAVVRKGSAAIRDAREVRRGERVEILLGEGELVASVEDVRGES